MKFKHYDTVGQAYKEQFKSLSKVAKRFLHNKSMADDVTQNAFTRAIEFKQAYPDKRISSYILFRNVIRFSIFENRNLKGVKNGKNDSTISK